LSLKPTLALLTKCRLEGVIGEYAIERGWTQLFI